jgi:hypothetical protein
VARIGGRGSPTIPTPEAPVKAKVSVFVLGILN